MLAVVAILVLLPGAFTPWVLPKEVALLLAALCASLARASGRLDRTTWIALSAGLAVVAVSALLGETPLAQVFGRWPRYEGLVSLTVYVAATWVGARVLGSRDRGASRIAVLTTAISWGALLLFAVSLLERMGLRPIPSDLERPGALLGNATDQGLVAAAFAALTLFGFVAAGSHPRGASTGRRALFAAATAAAITTVALSGSRAAVLALAVALLVTFALLVAWTLRHRTDAMARLRRRAGWALGAATTLAAIALLAVPMARSRLLGTSALATRTIGDRLVIWRETLSLIGERPWTGVGPDGFAEAVVQAHGPDWYATADPGTVLDSPHNLVLQVAVSGGVPLLLWALVFVGWVVVRATRSVRTTFTVDTEASIEPRVFTLTAIGALAGIATAWLTHFPIASTAILAGVLLGSVIAVEPVSESSRRRTARSVAFAVWATLLAIATAAELALAAGIEARTAPEADARFSAAAALRPWDVDIPSIAAQAMTARADAGQEAAASLAVRWGERAIDAAPSNVPATVALGVALRLDGRFEDSVATLGAMAEVLPLDPDVAVQHGISLAAAGALDRARAELERADGLEPLAPPVRDLLDRLEQAS